MQRHGDRRERDDATAREQMTHAMHKQHQAALAARSSYDIGKAIRILEGQAFGGEGVRAPTESSPISEARELCEQIEESDADLKEGASQATAQFQALISTATVLFSQSQTRFLDTLSETDYVDLLLFYLVLSFVGIVLEVAIKKAWFSARRSNWIERAPALYVSSPSLQSWPWAAHESQIAPQFFSGKGGGCHVAGCAVPTSYAYLRYYRRTRARQSFGYLFYRVVLALVRVFYTYSLFVLMALIRDRIEQSYADEPWGMPQIVPILVVLMLYFAITQSIDSIVDRF